MIAVKQFFGSFGRNPPEDTLYYFDPSRPYLMCPDCGRGHPWSAWEEVVVGVDEVFGGECGDRRELILDTAMRCPSGHVLTGTVSRQSEEQYRQDLEARDAASP